MIHCIIQFELKFNTFPDTRYLDDLNPRHAISSPPTTPALQRFPPPHVPTHDIRLDTFVSTYTALTDAPAYWGSQAYRSHIGA